MSNRYKGGIISATPPTTTGGESGVASGAWTLEQQMQAQAAGLWPIQPPTPYIEDVFSTYLYKGNSLTQTITNGINLSTKGGLVWIKSRDTTFDHMVFDTSRGASKYLNTNNTTAQSTNIYQLSSFDTNGFTLGDGNFTNNSAYNYASWTFRKQPKFFDVVTYTGTGSARTVAHNLGSTPGCIITKNLTTAGNWGVYHRSTTATNRLLLNTTDASGANSTYWNDTEPTSTQFTVGSAVATNSTGDSYVAYIFAHNAGGFGLTGTDNVISCGSFTTSGGGGDATVDLGYEPQWLLVKSASGTSGWDLMDNMRGMPNYGTYGSATALEANNSNAEGSRNPNCYPTSTGFYYARAASTTYIYIAIRRGPMKVPTDGTSVFSPITNSATTGTVNTTGFPVDMGIVRWRTGTDSNFLRSRLQGVSTTTTESGAWLKTNATDAESTAGGLTRLWDNTGFQTTSGFSGYSTVYWNFRRAPSFFDEVCCSTNTTLTNHNLGVAPEMVIYKTRDVVDRWYVLTANNGYGSFNRTNGWLGTSFGNGLGANLANVTSTTMNSGEVLYSAGYNVVAYLFATCAGVSKVGNYTGTGTTLQVDCGFTGGARFLLIKRVDDTGDWYVWDTARGIVSGNDPYLLLNTTAAEVTNTDYIDTYSAGFEITSTAPAAINASGGTFIFLAIA